MLLGLRGSEDLDPLNQGEKSIAKGVGEGSETPEKKNPSESVKVRIWLFRHRQVSRDFFPKSLDRQQRWRPRTSNRNYWWYSLSIYDMYLLLLIMVPSGKDWRNTVGGITTVSFEDCYWNDYTSVARAPYEIWNPLKITFIILKISAILGIYHWIARYCSYDGIEPCASIRSSGLLKNSFFNFLH